MGFFLKKLAHKGKWKKMPKTYMGWNSDRPVLVAEIGESFSLIDVLAREWIDVVVKIHGLGEAFAVVLRGKLSADGLFALVCNLSGTIEMETFEHAHPVRIDLKP